jgi:hypothetical protein
MDWTRAHRWVIGIQPHAEQVFQTNLLGVSIRYSLGVPAVHDFGRIDVGQRIKAANV